MWLFLKEGPHDAVDVGAQASVGFLELVHEYHHPAVQPCGESFGQLQGLAEQLIFIPLGRQRYPELGLGNRDVRLQSAGRMAGEAPAANANFPAGPNNPLGAVVAQNANANRAYSRRLNQFNADADIALILQEEPAPIPLARSSRR